MSLESSSRKEKLPVASKSVRLSRSSPRSPAWLAGTTGLLCQLLAGKSGRGIGHAISQVGVGIPAQVRAFPAQNLLLVVAICNMRLVTGKTDHLDFRQRPPPPLSCQTSHALLYIVKAGIYKSLLLELLLSAHSCRYKTNVTLPQLPGSQIETEDQEATEALSLPPLPRLVTAGNPASTVTLDVNKYPGLIKPLFKHSPPAPTRKPITLYLGMTTSYGPVGHDISAQVHISQNFI